MASLVGNNYSEALFELALEESSVLSMKEELVQIQQVFQENAELKAVLAHPQIEKEEKKKLIQRVFECNATLSHFLLLLIDKGRIDDLDDIIEAYLNKANEHLGVEVATITSAVALTPEEIAKIKVVLMKKTGKTIEIQSVLDSRCIAGIRVQIADEVLDNTVNNKLKKFKERVAAATLAS